MTQYSICVWPATTVLRNVLMATNLAASNRVKILEFWKTISEIKPLAKFHLMDKVDVDARIVSVNGDQSQVLVEQLSTQIGTYESAIIRGDDLVYIDIDLAQIAAHDHHPNTDS
uniref:Uncharacterized protein n=1 Tax=Spongospora subterranea TaxID=70186 RepID=A0A0H5QWC1_9EUKA|eukprot:CRZ06204.1 hypothetical protein [Spongospora subterranea]